MSYAHRRPFLEDDLYEVDETPTEPCSSPMVEAARALALSEQFSDDDRDDEPATQTAPVDVEMMLRAQAANGLPSPIGDPNEGESSPPREAPRARFATLPMFETADLAQRRMPLEDALAQTLAATPEATPYGYAPLPAPQTPPPFAPSSPRQQAFTGSIVLPPSSVRRAFIAALQPEPPPRSFPRWLVLTLVALASVVVVVALGEIVMRLVARP